MSTNLQPWLDYNARAVSRPAHQPPPLVRDGNPAIEVMEHDPNGTTTRQLLGTIEQRLQQLRAARRDETRA